jgi:hypothetical protein
MGNATTEYNGWRNYETWLVNMWLTHDAGGYELLSGKAHTCWSATDEDDTAEDRAVAAVRQLATLLKETYDEELDSLDMPPASLWMDMLTGALSTVDWREIAEHMIADVDQD